MREFARGGKSWQCCTGGLECPALAEPATDGLAEAAQSATPTYKFVTVVVAALSIPRRVSPYRLAVRLWAHGDATDSPEANSRRAQVAPVYVMVWMAVELALLFASQRWAGVHWAEIVVACVGGWRFIEIATYQAVIVLSRQREHSVLAAFERSLILLAFNVIEFSLLCAVWLRAAGFGSATRSWFNGFLLVTLSGLPPEAASLSERATTEIDIVTVAGTAGAVLLIVCGVALLVGLIGQKFREFGT